VTGEQWEVAMAEVYSEYVGLTAEASALIERHRQTPIESKSEILVRVLLGLNGRTASAVPAGFLDLGQGAWLRVGEKPVLFLSEEAKRKGQPDAVAEVRKDGFYMDGKRIERSKGSVLQPAMKMIQERKKHRNDKGEIISLSAWRQWHVVRDGRLLSMVELKDPALAHKRGRAANAITLEELGL
jgi:hypothetical protein